MNNQKFFKDSLILRSFFKISDAYLKKYSPNDLPWRWPQFVITMTKQLALRKSEIQLYNKVVLFHTDPIWWRNRLEVNLIFLIICNLTLKLYSILFFAGMSIQALTYVLCIFCNNEIKKEIVDDINHCMEFLVWVVYVSQLVFEVKPFSYVCMYILLLDI